MVKVTYSLENGDKVYTLAEAKKSGKSWRVTYEPIIEPVHKFVPKEEK